MDRASVYCSIPDDSKVKSAAWPMTWVGGHLAMAYIHSCDPSELSQRLCHRR